MDLVLVIFLRREGTLLAVLGEVCPAIVEFKLDHVDDALEPLGKKDCVLPAARLAKIRVAQSVFGCLILQVLGDPGWYLLVIPGNAWLGQLIGQVVQGVQEFASIGSSIRCCIGCFSGAADAWVTKPNCRVTVFLLVAFALRSKGLIDELIWIFLKLGKVLTSLSLCEARLHTL